MASATETLTFACQPTTQRGKGILIDGHTASRCIAYCNGKAVILRSLDDPRQATVYTEHSYPATVARFSPNGEWVASGDSAGNVRVWARGGEHKLKYELKALGGGIEDLTWSEDGQRVVVCGDGKSQLVRAFMWDSGGNQGEFEGHSKKVLSCALRPKRPFRVFSGGEDFAVNYYEGPPFRFKASKKEHTNFVNCVRFSPDGSKVVSVSSDRSGLLFNGLTGERTGRLSPTGGHSGSIYAAAWSPDSMQLVTVSADKTAKVWHIAQDGSSGEVVASFGFPLPSAQPLVDAAEAAASGDNGPTTPSAVDHMQVGCLWIGDTILTVSLSGAITLLPAPPSATPPCPALGYILGHSKYITAMALAPPTADSPEGDIYTGSYDGRVVRWSESGGPEGVVAGAGHTSIAAMACASAMLVTLGLDDTLRLTPLPALSFTSSLPPVVLGAQPKGVSVAGQQAGPVVLVATVKGLQLLRGTAVLLSLPLSFEPSAVALAPDAGHAAVGSSADGLVRLFRVELGGDGGSMSEDGVLERHRGPITALAYSPDGTMLVSGDQNREAVVWDCTSREAVMKNLVYHSARVSAVAWAPDSTALATTSLDMSIIVYWVKEPPSKRVTIRGAHAGGVTALAFQTPTKLVSAGHDACLRFWSLPSPP